MDMTKGRGGGSAGAGTSLPLDSGAGERCEAKQGSIYSLPGVSKQPRRPKEPGSITSFTTKLPNMKARNSTPIRRKLLTDLKTKPEKRVFNMKKYFEPKENLGIISKLTEDDTNTLENKTMLKIN